MGLLNFIQSANKIYHRLVSQGVAKNLRPVGNSCVSGATLEGNIAGLRKLKAAGIDTIVDFRSEASSIFGQTCKTEGFDYMLFPIGHTRSGLSGKSVSIENIISDEYVEQLKKFIETVNEKNVYMGCHYGIDRTNLGLVLNYLLNPKAAPPKIVTWGDFRTKSVINRTLKKARKIIKKMTPEQRQKLGLDENYNELFQQKINSLLALNLYT